MCDCTVGVVCSCSGPIVLLRLELGVLSRGCVGPVELVCEYLRLGHIDKVDNTNVYYTTMKFCVWLARLRTFFSVYVLELCLIAIQHLQCM